MSEWIDNKVQSMRSNFREFAANCLFVRDHTTKKILPFNLNRPQRILDNVVEKMSADIGYVRIILDKARRFGGSTYIEGRGYWKTSLNFNINAFIVAHEEDSTDTLFGMARLFHEQNPLKPKTKYSSKKELLFDTKEGNGLKSEYSLACAKTTSAGRSQGVHFLHGCLSPDTGIVNGKTGSLVRMGDFEIGDLVRTHTGDIAPVSFISEGKREAKHFKVKGLQDFPLVATDNHRFWTPDGWTRAQNLREGDLIGFPVSEITSDGVAWHFRLPDSVRPQGGGSRETGPDYVEPSYSLGRILGLYLAEGCIIKQSKEPKHPSAITFAVHEREAQRTEEWLDEVSDLFSSRKTAPRKTSKTVTVTAYGRSFASFVRSVCGELDAKHLPDIWHRCGPEFCRGLVHGYLAGDGHSSRRPGNRRITASSVRSAITVGIRDCLASLGYGWSSIANRRAGIRHGRNEREQWVLSLCGAGVDSLVQEIGWTMPERKRPGYGETRISDGYAWLPIVSITPCGPVDIMDFEIDHPDHSYCSVHGATHNSEVAFWEGNPDDLLDGLMSCISDPKDTEVYLESTGNGFGNRFQRDVFDAYCEGKYPYYIEDGITYAWKNPKTDWVLVFIPWFAHEVYTRKFYTEKEKQDFWLKINRPVFDKETMRQVESEPLRLMKLCGLTLEQLNWREWMIENTFKGRTENFQQEFPATVEESFLTKGANLYGKVLCDMLEAACREPMIVGDPVDRQGFTKIKPNPYGHLKLWERPDKTMSYFATVDAGGGVKKSQEDAGREPDPTCIDIWNHRTGQQAAQWHGHVHYGMIHEIVELLGNLYFRAPACVELNNHGYTVCDNLTKKSYPQYEMKPGEPGWMTTKKSRPQMLDSLHELAEGSVLQIRSKETVSEMRTFVEINMKYQAEQGCHDERVITAAMASQMMQLLPKRMSPQEQKDHRGRVGAQIGQYDPGLDRNLPPSKIRPPDISIGGWMDRHQKQEPDGSIEVRVGI